MYDLKPGQLIECEFFRVDDDFWKYRHVGYVKEVTSDGLTLTTCYGVNSKYSFEYFVPEDANSIICGLQYIPWAYITDLWILSEA